MAKKILMEEFHITVLAPAGLLKLKHAVIRRTLNSKRFQASLHKGIRQVVRRHPSLKYAEFRLSR